MKSSSVIVSDCRQQQCKNNIVNKNNNNSNVVSIAQISQTLYHLSSLSSIATGRSSMLYPVSLQSCCPTLVRRCEGVHRSTSFMSSPLFLQLCPACLDRVIYMVFEMGAVLWGAISRICSIQLRRVGMPLKSIND